MYGPKRLLLDPAVNVASHQPGSQDSILRECPGGGGVSLNRTPLASLRVPGPKKLPPCGASARGRKLRSALSAVRRSTDILAGGGGKAGKAVSSLICRGDRSARSPAQVSRG